MKNLEEEARNDAYLYMGQNDLRRALMVRDARIRELEKLVGELRVDMIQQRQKVLDVIAATSNPERWFLGPLNTSGRPEGG